MYKMHLKKYHFPLHLQGQVYKLYITFGKAQKEVWLDLSIFIKNTIRMTVRKQIKLPSHIKSEHDSQAFIKLLHLLQENISFLGSQTKHYVRGL